MKAKYATFVIESKEEVSSRWRSALKGKAKSHPNEEIISVPSWEILSKIMSPMRLQLLAIIHSKKPVSIAALAREAKRDFKNVYEDVTMLKELGLLDLKKVGKSHAPVVRVSGVRFSFSDLGEVA